VRYNCDFEHRDTGEHKTIPVALTAEQVKSVEAIRGAADQATVLAMAYALNHAYREVPHGFLHTKPPELIHLS
jgi:hypothetical protein